MKNFLLLCVLAASIYVGIHLNEKRGRQPEPVLETIPDNTIVEATPAAKKSWLQDRIDSRESKLDKGAYDQRYGVARGATFYAVPAEPVATPIRTGSR